MAWRPRELQSGYLLEAREVGAEEALDLGAPAGPQPDYLDRVQRLGDQTRIPVNSAVFDPPAS